MKIFKSKLLASLVLACFCSHCAVKTDQFAHAVHTGNVNAAQTYHEPGYANMKFSLTSKPGKYSLPIQYAILQKNKPMAKFLVDNGSQNRLDGKNLAYYCSYNGKSEMANYFASIGQGSYSDISKAKRDRAASSRASSRSYRAGAGLIGLFILGAMMGGMGGSGSSGGGCVNCGASTPSGGGHCTRCKAYLISGG